MSHTKKHKLTPENSGFHTPKTANFTSQNPNPNKSAYQHSKRQTQNSQTAAKPQIQKQKQNQYKLHNLINNKPVTQTAIKHQTINRTQIINLIQRREG